MDETIPYFHVTEELREACARAMVQQAAQEVSPAPQPISDSTSSFPYRDFTKPAEQQGLFHKFAVRRVDGSSLPGGKHHGCEYFVLDLDHDDHAPAALRAYALACSTSYPKLSADLLARYPTVSAAEVQFPIPDKTLYGADRTVSGHFYTAAKVRTYGEQCRAAGYAAGLAAVGWRDVADELPKEAQEVLFVRGGKTVHGAWIGGIFWHSNQKMAAAKWMPLPAPQTDAALRGEVKPAESTNQQQGETK